MVDTAQLVARVKTDGVKRASTELTQFSKSAANADRTAENFSKTAGKAGKNTAMFGRNAGQAGIQVQQFVGQVQGGQSAMLALSQQSADLGIVLGAPMVGVVVALGAAIIGTLVPSMGEAEDSTKTLETALDDLNSVVDESSAGILGLSDDIIKMSKVNQDAARSMIQVGIADAMLSIETSAKLAAESLKDVFPASRGRRASAYANQMIRVAEDLGVTKKEALSLSAAFRELNKEQDAESLSNLQDNLDQLVVKYGQSAPEIIKLAKNTREYTTAAELAASKQELLIDTQGRLNDAVLESSLGANLNENRVNELAAFWAAQDAADIERQESLISRKTELSRAFAASQEADQIAHLNAMTAEEDKAAKASLKLELDTQKEKEAAIDRGFSNVAQLSTSGNKTLGAIGKAAAIAQTTRSGITAISNAAAINPYPVGLALAAAEGANMGLRLSQIRSAGNFAKGGFIDGNSYSGDRITANVNSGEAVLNIQQQREFMNMANGGGGGGPSVIVNNNAPGTKATAQKTDDGRIVVIVQEVLNREVTQPNSNFNKNMDATRNAPRLR